MSEGSEAEAGAKPAAQAAEGQGSLLDELLAEAKIAPSEDVYGVAKRGVQAFITEMLAPDRKGERIDKATVDAMIAELDTRISAQTNEILHHPEFQKLESAWRGLKYLVDQCDFRENIKIEVVDVSKQALLEDFEDSPEIVKSGLYQIAYTAEYGTFGGEPYGMIVSNYDFGPGPQDVELLQNIASVSAMSHAPFLASAGPQFFGEDTFTEFSKLKELGPIFEGPRYAKWRSFRESEDARYVGLTCPRFVLRQPYGPETVPVKSFDFKEEVVGSHDAYLWGASSFALAARVADSFAKYRWCPNIIGPQSGGAVENLPLHTYQAMGDTQAKIPTEVQITDRQEFELAEQGFVGLVYRKDSDNAAFFSANSAQKSKLFGNTAEGKAAETNYRLGTQLPYMFVITRLAHYLKVMQREQIGSWKERGDLERELNKWIKQYVVAMDNPVPEVRSKCPLREASIQVEDVEGQPGWYRCRMQVRPHFKYMGADFTLSLVGKLDKE
jgi:type VI secretion system protein ImpC